MFTKCNTSHTPTPSCLLVAQCLLAILKKIIIFFFIRNKQRRRREGSSFLILCNLSVKKLTKGQKAADLWMAPLVMSHESESASFRGHMLSICDRMNVIRSGLTHRERLEGYASGLWSKNIWCGLKEEDMFIYSFTVIWLCSLCPDFKTSWFKVQWP